MNRSHATRNQQGLSLIDSLIALCVSSVALGAAVPGFKEASERRHLEGAAAQLETDMQFAKGLAAMQNHTLRLGFQKDSSGACYIVHSGQAKDCTCGPEGAPICTPGAQAFRYAHFAGDGPVKLQSNVSSIIFQPTIGTVTPTGTFRFTGKSGRELRLVVNIMGRIRDCTPDKGVPGHPSC